MYSAFIVPGEDKFRKALRTHQMYEVLFSIFLQHWVDTAAGRLSVSEGIIISVVSTLVLTRFINLSEIVRL